MIWLCGPYQEFTESEREKLAKLAACGDPVQEAINSKALQSCGAVVTVEERPEAVGPNAPPWVVVNLQTGNLMTFMGLGVVGGDTREEAFERAVRIGLKNDMSVVDLETEDAYYLCLHCGMTTHVDFNWRWFYYDGEELLESEEGTAKEVAECPECGYQHALCEAGSNVFFGTREECRARRKELLDAGGHSQEEWSELLDRVRKARA